MDFGPEAGEDAVVWSNLAQDGTQVIVVVVHSRLAVRQVAGAVVGDRRIEVSAPDQVGKWPDRGLARGRERQGKWPLDRFGSRWTITAAEPARPVPRRHFSVKMRAPSCVRAPRRKLPCKALR